MTPKEWLTKSERDSSYAHDLLEQAPGGTLNNAATEILASLQALRQVVRLQQAQIERLLAAVPSAGEKV